MVELDQFWETRPINKQHHCDWIYISQSIINWTYPFKNRKTLCLWARVNWLICTGGLSEHVTMSESYNWSEWESDALTGGLRGELSPVVYPFAPGVLTGVLPSYPGYFPITSGQPGVLTPPVSYANSNNQHLLWPCSAIENPVSTKDTESRSSNPIMTRSNKTAKWSRIRWSRIYERSRPAKVLAGWRWCRTGRTGSRWTWGGSGSRRTRPPSRRFRQPDWAG